MNMPWAVSGRRYAAEAVSSTGPMCVLNMRLNWRASDSGPPHSGQRSDVRWSARHRLRHVPRQSTSGSLKPLTWPEATHTSGWAMIVASIPTTSSLRSTTWRHQRPRMLRRRATP